MRSCAFSHLAYYETPHINRKLRKLESVRLIKTYEGACNNDAHACMFQDREKLILSFRGTTTKSDFVDALDIRHSFFEEAGTRLHRGFYKRFNAIEPIITRDLVAMIHKNPEHEVLFTGHSMGGALAAIACGFYGRRLSKYNLHCPPLVCHTFASPQFADAAMGVALRKHAAEHISVHAEEDLVPLLPIHRQFKHLPYVLELRGDAVASCLIESSPSYSALIQKLVDLRDIQMLYKHHSCVYYYEKLGSLLKHLHGVSHGVSPPYGDSHV
jgi:hypothetical protein